MLHEVGHARRVSGRSVLRARIRAAHVPPPLPGNLRLATWNIRELGKHRRLDESIELIAEILRTFDLVAIVELRDDLEDARRILHALGPRWSMVFSDYLLDAGGNRERIGFIYDRSGVTFTGLASNAEAPRRRVGEHYRVALPWWRLPFMASFKAGTFDFIVLAAHVRWGANASARRDELCAVVDWIVRRSKERSFSDQNVIVVGDFNVATPSTVATILSSRGLVLPPGIGEEVRTNLAQSKRYDQILCLPHDAARFTGRGGALDFYAGDHQALMGARRMSKAAFTAQVSDHLPLWAEVATR